MKRSHHGQHDDDNRLSLNLVSDVSVTDQQLMEVCRGTRDRKASLKGKEAGEQEPDSEEEAGSRCGKRVVGSRCEHNRHRCGCF